MQAVRVILDWPGPRRNHERLEFGPPRRIVSAYRIADVRPAFRDAEAAARRGAWVAGFIAYEAAPAFDSALVTRPPGPSMPLVWFGIFDDPVITRPPARASALAHDLTRLEWRPDVPRAEYDAAIRRIRDAIAAGDVYQVNHTLRFRATCDSAPADIYDALVTARHGVYHTLIETPEWAVVSASPELFIDVQGGTIMARPMKGTARRGRWAAEDAAAAARLARSPKDRAENLMIVDLLRNDLGRVARFGSVDVPEMFAVETYPTVHQMTSTITATLRDNVGIDDIFAATFPCGSVTGAPKIAAMQHIARLERSPRGAYCGAAGLMRPDGTATFNVAIRTLVIDRQARVAVYGAGGGITWESQADAEYDETIAKAALLGEPTPDFELLETMRLENGLIPRLHLHLARLTDSARYWAFPDEAPGAAAAALERMLATAPPGAWRVRMTVSRDGHVGITRVQLEHPFRESPARDAAAFSPAPVERVALARTPVDSRDPLLHHKTTARAVYDAHRAEHPDAFDVLLHNQHGFVTEFTIGNVVCEIDGELVTPPLSAGLLAGAYRAELLGRGVIRERDVGIGEIGKGSRMWRVSSLRGWVEVEVEVEVGDGG